jgi:Uncharacterized protein conserved in bacteria
MNSRLDLSTHGFWEYTSPGVGGAEHFQRDDYLELLDDMAGAGMRSLMLVVKWLTTGYRSRITALDQDPTNPVIASGNDLLREVIDEAHARGIAVHLGAVLSMYDVERFPGTAHVTMTEAGGWKLPMEVGLYTADDPAVAEIGAELIAELWDEFPAMDGLLVELEGSGRPTAERRALYDAWAERHGEQSFDAIAPVYDGRGTDIAAWRRFTTDARIDLLTGLERGLVDQGFGGRWFSLCETGNYPYAVFQEIDLTRMRDALPHWEMVLYDYDKWSHRAAMMDFCIDQPRQLGMTASYLARGIMTWSTDGSWPLPMQLRDHWALDREDIERHEPGFVWWFGAGSRGEGLHTSLARVQEHGFRDGTDARRKLLKLLTS